MTTPKDWKYGMMQGSGEAGQNKLHSHLSLRSPSRDSKDSIQALPHVHGGGSYLRKHPPNPYTQKPPLLPWLSLSGKIVKAKAIAETSHKKNKRKSAVNPWPLASVQEQKNSPIWGAVKKETFFSANSLIVIQLNYEASRLWNRMAMRWPLSG